MCACEGKDWREGERHVRELIMAVVASMLLLLPGCSGTNIEAQAYAVSMGIDLTDDSRVEVSVQMPTLSGGGDAQESGSGGGKGYTFASAAGDTLTEALELLNATAPRELNLTGVKSIIVSRRLAQDDLFREVLEELALAYRVYGAAELIVCAGEAKSFIRDQKAVIGQRVSESISVSLEHYRRAGIIPSAKAADVFYLSRSMYGDPAAVFAAEEGDEQGAGYAGALDVSGGGKSQYYGAVLFADGRMVGKLTGMQTQLLNVLLGDLPEFSWVVDGVPVRIIASRPKVRIDLSGGYPLIDAELTIKVMDSEGGLSPARLEEVVLERLNEMTEYCQSIGTDPFRYAEHAVRHFLTVDKWLEYNWRERFVNAEIRYRVEVEQSEL